MERYVNKKLLGERTWYAFNGEYAALFQERDLTICHLPPDYNNKELKGSPLKGPYIHIYLLKQQYLRDYCLSESLPLQMVFSGPKLGYVNKHSGYAAADVGMFQRAINSITTKLSTKNNDLKLKLIITASAVNPSSAHAELSDAEEKPILLEYEMTIPISTLPEVLNMNELERNKLERILNG